MNIIKLTAENYKKISGKKICVIGRNSVFINELCKSFDILERIEYIIDSNPRNKGDFSVDTKTFYVQNFDYLLQINWNDMVIVFADDYYRELYLQIEAELDLDLEGIEIYYFADSVMECEEYYRSKLSDRALEDVVVFRSGPHSSSYVRGMDFGDNARALFEYMLANDFNKKYRLVWIVKNPEDFSAYNQIENVCFLAYDDAMSDDKAKRDRYYELLYLAKYIFFTDAYGFAKNCREDQVRVQLWHGCGFKTRVNFVRCEHRYEYNIVISDKYKEIHEDIYGLRPEQVLITGYPKEDWLFERETEYLNLLNIPKGKKYIFWLPTFRSTNDKLAELNEYQLSGDTGLPIVDSREKLDELNQILEHNDMFLIIKLHPFQDESTIASLKYSNIFMVDNKELAEKDIQINQILGLADALISDYSSGAVDFLILDRPMAFTLADVEDYKNSRGFVFDNIEKWLPGKKIYHMNDFMEFVTEIGSDIDSTKKLRGDIRKIMHSFDDNNSCKRVLEALKIRKG